VTQPVTDKELTQDLFGTSPEDIKLATGRGSREVQYWKLCERPECYQHTTRKGWVVIGPAYSPRTAVEYIEFQQHKHATPLDKYGKSSSGAMFEGETRLIPLIESGGIHEIPFTQLVAYGWHRRPLIVKAIPELAKVVDIPCEYGCTTEGPDARLFTTVMDYQNHCSVMHRDVVGANAMGQQIKGTIESLGAVQNRWSKEDLVELAKVLAVALKGVDK
jgi:hypothetical protein